MTIYTHDYDSTNYDPAAPIVELGVAKPGLQSPSLQLLALVDSGADATMLPINVLQNVQARYMTTRQMRGVSGHPIVVEMYLTTLFIGTFAFSGIEVIAGSENSEAIVGRDVLNQMIVTLNGLASSVEMSQ